MTIHIVEELADFLSSELAWRKKELSILRFLLQANQEKPAKARPLIRSGTTILYSHWEGFVKTAGTAYLEFIERQHLPYSQLALHVRAVGLRGHLTPMSASGGIEARTLLEIVDLLVNRQAEKCALPWRDAINTKSNLNSAVLQNILLILGLDYAPYATKEKLIDNVLLAYRNPVAHGENICPTFDEYEQLYREVMVMIELFRNQIENAAVMRSYMLP